MKRIIGLDMGSKTIGVAVSDPLKITAQGVENFRYDEWNEEQAVNKIIDLIGQWNVEFIIYGMPKHMNGDMSDTGRYIEKVANKVFEKTNMPFKYIDERWTSKQAERSMISFDMSRKKRKQVIDKTASVIILQTYLDQI